MISDDDKRTAGAPHEQTEEHPLPVAEEEEPESFHPAVGESWAPKSRDDHMNGLRNSAPDLRPATKVQREYERPKAGFFGAISDAFDLSHEHGNQGAAPSGSPAAAVGGKPRKPG